MIVLNISFLSQYRLKEYSNEHSNYYRLPFYITFNGMVCNILNITYNPKDNLYYYAMSNEENYSIPDFFIKPSEAYLYGIYTIDTNSCSKNKLSLKNYDIY